MSNMSYCRFENTLRDLEDCAEAIAEQEKLSESERKAKNRLIELCIDIANDYSPDND